MPQNNDANENQRQKHADVLAYLGFLQNTIARMNTNSMQCKMLCVVMVASLLAVFSSLKKQEILYFSYVVVFVFLVMDATYLGLERIYIRKYNYFARSLMNNEFDDPALFDMIPNDNILFPCRKTTKCGIFFEGLCSWSVYLIYTMVFGGLTCIVQLV